MMMIIVMIVMIAIMIVVKIVIMIMAIMMDECMNVRVPNRGIDKNFDGKKLPYAAVIQISGLIVVKA